jgi:hypothetical protein
VSVKLPLLAGLGLGTAPALRGGASGSAPALRGGASGSAPARVEQARSPIERSGTIDVGARAHAERCWIAIIGAPGDEAPVRFACALALALSTRVRYALLGMNAPKAVEQALRDAGCEPVRLSEPADESVLRRALTALPADGIALAVESELAAQRRGLLDIWVGPSPSLAHGAALLALHAAADVIVPASALGTANALGAALARRLANASVRINSHTNAA